MDKMRSAKDKISTFLHSRYFDARHKTKIHILQIVVVITMFILSAVRTSSKPAGMPVARSDTIGIVMGVKTIVILLYQLLTSHMDRFRKWGSLKAYAILNSLEIVFWFAVVIVTFMTMSSFCQGLYCGMGFLVAVFAILLIILAFWTAVVSIRNYRAAKRGGKGFESDSSEVPYSKSSYTTSENPRSAYHQTEYQQSQHSPSASDRHHQPPSSSFENPRSGYNQPEYHQSEYSQSAEDRHHRHSPYPSEVAPPYPQQSYQQPPSNFQAYRPDPYAQSPRSRSFN